MKTNKWIYAIMIASLCWVACDDDDVEIGRPSLNDADETFVEMAARTNLAEIEFGGLAATKGTDSLVKAYGEDMVAQHTSAQNELEDIADDFDNVDWPDELDEGHNATWEQLNGLEGHSFDSAYMRSQVTLHEDAVTSFQTASTSATETKVKSYASKYLPDIEMHLERADSIETVITAANNGTDGTDGTDGTTGN